MAVVRYVFALCTFSLAMVLLAENMSQGSRSDFLATAELDANRSGQGAAPPQVVPVEPQGDRAPTVSHQLVRDVRDEQVRQRSRQSIVASHRTTKSPRTTRRPATDRVAIGVISQSVPRTSQRPLVGANDRGTPGKGFATRREARFKNFQFDSDLEDFEHSLSQGNVGRLASRAPLKVAEAPRRRPTVKTVESLPESLPESAVETNDAQPSDTAAGEQDEQESLAQPADDEELSPRMLALKDRIESVLGHFYPRMLNTRDKGHWAIMHSLIPFGVDKEIRVGGPNGRRVNAIGWIAWNGVCAGERLFYLSNGKIYARTGPGVQGHHGQFLAMLAQSRVKQTYPMKISGQDFTVAELIRREQETCVPHSELTFKLIGISHYVDSETEWKDEQGRDWTIARMVKDELSQPIIGAACGGTHRLFGLTYAVHKRRKQGHPIDGQFERAKIFLDEYTDYTFKLQNQDGSFSTRFFAGRGADSSKSRRLETTGHIAEWLTLQLTDEQLREDRMVKAVEHLAEMLDEGRDHYWKVGPLGHGLHALNRYHRRVFGPWTPDKPGSAEEDGERVAEAKSESETK
ncbi:MAG: hypothetical protein DWQ31_11055 [Planctomycetota bacterium]|nr:MAG: hypothetical protein DWQ31_11055 [Planctomycetota bacterium]